MGFIVVAACPCRFESDFDGHDQILVGSGMMGMEGGVDYFPCLCNACHGVVQVNLKAREKRCPKCRSRKVSPYSDTRLSDTPGEIADEDKLSGQQLEGNYLCPKCGNMTLHFHTVGHWD